MRIKDINAALLKNLQLGLKTQGININVGQGLVQGP